jgi:predicted dehydrogenase
MKTIRWGIIGCGDVTEIKSGPAFNLVPNSRLVAVMRRNAEKAEKYALRHGVPKWYSDAQQLIDDPEVDAIYVATPPLNHAEFTIEALRAGKPVYVEKPMAMNADEAGAMLTAAREHKTKLVVAHYRRALPLFLRIRELLRQQVIGDIRFVNLQLLQPPQSQMIANSEENWRTNPLISGGGLFHDLAPHQLDLMYWLFGAVKKAAGIALNQNGGYEADDIISGEALFESGVVFKGLWCFTTRKEEARDQVEIIGSKGKITFPVFGNSYNLTANEKEQHMHFDQPKHVQQPMIEQVVNYFLGQAENPCPASEAIEVMKLIDAFAGR